MLSNQLVCTVVNTCFRVVHQAGKRLLELFTGQESTQLGDDQPVLNPWNGLPYP
ncbi:hypothetical protein DY000_02057720 [Brassica cretica]|uniref:Uncharacterized protein n=1 Tax=Brassica cretica TaxID=69181 RepID=A0ABQ7A5G0_BRACR|nr:hypothetical protein DY000_02057720 [Brassica cretica]